MSGRGYSALRGNSNNNGRRKPDDDSPNSTSWTDRLLIATAILLFLGLAVGIIIAVVNAPTTPDSMIAVREALERAKLYDTSVKIQYIPSKPPFNLPCPGAPFEDQYITAEDVEVPAPGSKTFPWTANTIPWKSGLTSANGGVFANGQTTSTNYYRKFQSIPYVLAFYAGLDFETIPVDSSFLTIFLKDFENRGANNLDKLEYMFALTSDKLPLYEDRIDELFNRVEDKIKDGTAPVLSTFRAEVVSWFLDVHVGHAAHPQFVIDYFTEFLDIIGQISNPNINIDDILIRGNLHADAVKAYMRDRVNDILVSRDRSTFVHHWNEAGLDTDALVTESLHNIVAFSQFTNTLFRAIVDAEHAKYAPGMHPNIADFWMPDPIVPPPLPSIDLFSKYMSATDDTDRLNIVRELFRVLTPNGNAFSKLNDDADPENVQTRNMWALTMIFNQPSQNPQVKIAQYFTYNPTLYYTDFNTTLFDHDPIPEDPLPLSNWFTFSSVDNNPTYNDGTVVQIQNQKVQPVFDDPLYLTFGPGYRRCPGEIFTYFVTKKMLDRFAMYDWEFRPVAGAPCNPEAPDMSRFIPIAPRTAPFDNLYVKPPPLPPLPPLSVGQSQAAAAA